MTFDEAICDAARVRAVLDLPIDELRALLRDGDPRQRVWAAWGLGLALGDDFSDELREVLAAEPVAGVRRHLTVMVAGYGDIDIVAAIARRDPDEYARATAARYVVALADSHPELWTVAREVVDDRASLVRESALRNLPASAPDDLRTLAVELEERERRHPVESPPDEVERTGELAPYREPDR